MKREAPQTYSVLEKLNNMVFIFECDSECKITPVSFGNNVFPKDDIIFYGVFFDPPIAVDSFMNGAFLDVYYNGKNPIGRGRVSLNLYPDDSKKEYIVLKSDCKYIVFDTHALRLDPHNDDNVQCVEFTIHNTQISERDNTPILQLLPSITPFMEQNTPKGGKFVDLSYYPADPDVMDTLQDIDCSMVPQRTPYWFKVRGAVTGSKAYKLCGFFQRSSANFDEAALKRMRFGRIMEDYICLSYIIAQGVTVSMCGFVPYNSEHTWGCSPDGKVHDAKMSWDNSSIPLYTKNDYSHLDIRFGALEIKASRSDCSMKDYYYPQIYLEMMTLETAWVDVVRYSEMRISNGQMWRTERKIRIYRVYRHKPTEHIITKCIKNGLEKGQSVYNNKEFIKLRSYLRDLANAAQYKEITPSDKLYEQYTEYITSKQNTAGESRSVKKHRVHHISEMEERQLDIFRLYEQESLPTKEFVSACLSQIQSLCELLKNKIEQKK